MRSRSRRIQYIAYPFRDKVRRRNPMRGGLDLSDDQSEALDRILAALDQPEPKALVLAGPAGTGKTTLMRALITELAENSVPTVLLAPTGKAASRLTETTQRPTSTIHRFIFVDPQTVGICPACQRTSATLAVKPSTMRREGARFYECPHCQRRFPLDTPFQRTLDFGQKSSAEMPAGRHVVIVDEASMVGKGLSRKLENAIPTGYRILYVGDREQLPPVTEPGEEPGWGPNFDEPTAALTSIHRQAAGNPIVQLATRLRTDKNRENPFLFSDDPNVLPPEGLQIIRGGGLAYAAGWCASMLKQRISSVLIAFGNRTVLELNNRMRDLLVMPDGVSLGERSRRERISFTRGDYLLVAANNPGADLQNGEIVRVMGAEKPPNGSKMSRAHLLTLTIDHPRRGLVRIVVFNALEAREKPGSADESIRPIYKIRPDVLREAFDDPARDLTARYREIERAAMPDRDGDVDQRAVELLEEYAELTPFELFEQAETVRPQDLVCATYGLAITGHKSQGSQWQRVGVVWESYMNEWWHDDKAKGNDLSRYATLRRWLYTAITRAQQETVIFDSSASFSTLVRSYGTDQREYPPARTQRAVQQAEAQAARVTPPAPAPTPAEVRQLQRDAFDRTVPEALRPPPAPARPTRAAATPAAGGNRWGLTLPTKTRKADLARFDAPIGVPEPITDGISVARLLDRKDEHGRKFILRAYAAMEGRQVAGERGTASYRNAIGWNKGSAAAAVEKYPQLMQGVKDGNRGAQKYMALVLLAYREQLSDALRGYTPNPRRR
jgi:hypothetical protein